MSCVPLSIKAHHRVLSEDQAVRILKRGGMVVRSGGRWQVYRTQDKRSACIGAVLPHIIERLDAEGVLRAGRKQPHRRTWANTVAETPKVLPVPESLRPRCRRRKTGPTSALDAALKYESDAMARIRLLAAVRRFVADWEQAATPQSVTTPWGAARVDGGRDVSRYAGPGVRAMAATARLKAVHTALGDHHLRAVEAFAVHNLSIAAFERHMWLSAGQGAATGHKALVALADAYDLRVRNV